MKRLFLTLALAVLAGSATVALAQENLPNVNNAMSLQQSDNGLFFLSAEPELRPMRLNTLHYWTLRLSDTQSRAVSGAKIAVDGGMPGHGHGLPTSPRVTPGSEPGQYILKGMRFNMGGVWELQLDIDDGEHSDKVRLQFVVTDTTGE